MEKKIQQVEYEEYKDASELPPEDLSLLQLARRALEDAYAPYSRFRVGAALLLDNGQTVTGTNQENASYPVGICAERTALSTASSLYPGIPVRALAVSYRNELGTSEKPISPCGICRQTICEYQQRSGTPIRLIMAGLSGPAIVIRDAGSLMPLSFSSSDML
ncbi:cytidine deaminase [Chitinophaga sp. GCM10012297]|uniref:Cytidine deaminase n=1 Tax=Chitinophaga chungangae TaxID=2821488 RepID=A0ABS3YKM5_9BACT|nr:cytidine deaminase [Chitinophaga chungangae]MBO9155251.1 cytidine deaminase [Chitinophaga chungangae]